MPLPRFAKQSVVVLTPGVLVERGEPVDDWSPDAVTRTVVSGCSVQPGNGSRDLDHRDGVMAAYTVFAPLGTVINGRHRVELPGIASGQFILLGEPLVHAYGFSVDNVQIALQRWLS